MTLTTTRSRFSHLILLLPCFLQVTLHAKGASATEWQTVYESDLTSGEVFNDWIPVQGDWALTPEGLKKSGMAVEGLLMLRVPVVKGAVRVEFEAKADAQPDDLSLYLGMKELDSSGAAFFGFASKSNTTHILRIPGRPPNSPSTNSLAVAGQWHKITVLREGGRLSLQVDRKTVAAGDDVRSGYPGPFMAFSSKNEGVFRKVKVHRRADSELRQHLSPEAVQREAGFPEARFSIQDFARNASRNDAQRDELRYARMDVQVRTTTERQPVYRQHEKTTGWGTVAKTSNGDVVAAITGSREAEDDPFGDIRFIRSSRDGRRWSEPVKVADSPLSDRDAGIVALKSGALLVTWRTSAGLEALGTFERSGSLDLARGVLIPADAPVRVATTGSVAASPADLARWKARQAEFTPVDLKQHVGFWCALSKDGGTTWGARMPTPVHSPHGPAVLRDGRLLYLGRTLIDSKPFLAAAESKDDGQSWQIVWKQSLHDDELFGLRDPHAVQCPDGRIVAVFRIAPKDWKRRGGEHALHCYVPDKIWQIESRDDGRTWTRPRITPMWGYPPHLTVLQDGRLLCTYGYRHTYYPFSQKACVSHDGGATWDFEHEITLRGDTWDAHFGFPSSVETDDGAILSLYSKSEAAGQRASIERTTWQVPPPPAPAKERAQFRVEMADPVLVAAGPLEERRWGFYQFPGYRLSPKGTIVGGYQTADDSHGGGARYENKKYCSHDGGKTWVPETEELRNERELTPGFVMKDGTGLSYAGFKTMRPGELGLKPLRRPPSWVFPTAEVYRYADLPAEMRLIRMKRRDPDGAEVEYEAPLEFPDLGMVRFTVGQNSETGLVALDAPLTPAWVRWGPGETCELPDGTLLMLMGALKIPEPSDTAPHFATCLVASTDGGRSWTYRSTIMGSKPEQRWEGTEEASIVRRPNGTLVCVVRVEAQAAGSTANLWITRSTDAGRTWEQPERLSVHTALPALIALDNGVVASVQGRPGITLRFSNDPDCRDWSNPHVLHHPIGLHYTNTGWQDSTCGYTSLVPLGPDRFLVVYSDFYYRDDHWTLHKAIKAREVKVTPAP